MKVLFVAFELPPLAAGGVHRSLKFLKYLPEYGITPIVLTTDLESYERRGFPVDESIDGLPESLHIERIPCLPTRSATNSKIAAWPRIFFSISEAHAKEWEPYIEENLPRILDTHKPDAIYVTLPPFGLGGVWCALAEKYGLPLVLDFRDNWSQWCVNANSSWFHYQLKLSIERRYLRVASRIICATEGVRRDLLAAHRDISQDKLLTITNGYDVDRTSWPTALRREPTKSGIVIGYVGSFYYSPSGREAMFLPWWKKAPHRLLHYSPRREDWLYRSPYFFFAAVKELLSRRPELRNRIKIRFVCHKPDWLDSQIEEFELTDIVECVGYMEHKDIPHFLSECDGVLATSAKVLEGLDYCIAGKTFDYFVAAKPILGFVTEGTQKQTLINSGLSVIFDPDDSQASATLLGDWIDGKIELLPDTTFLQSFHRRELTRQLAEAFLALRN